MSEGEDLRSQLWGRKDPDSLLEMKNQEEKGEVGKDFWLLT